MATLLRKVVSYPESSSKWQDLFNWSQSILSAPKRGGKHHNLASTIKRRISSYPTGQPVQASANPTHVEHRQTNSTPTISQAVSAKLEDGNVRAALRILMSDDRRGRPSGK